jgi:uncharacterized protein (TIGR02246 family)
MKRLPTLSVAASIVLAIAGCNRAADAHEADVKALQANEAQWNQDFLSKDPDKLAAHYADDAVLMVSGSPPAAGINAIRITMKQMESDPAFLIKFQPSKVDIAKSGDLAYTQGSYTLTATDPLTKQVINDHGSYVTTYRKQQDGTWKAVADIATSEVPPPTPAPAAAQ